MARFSKASFSQLLDAYEQSMLAQSIELGIGFFCYGNYNKGFDRQNGYSQVRGKGKALNVLYGKWNLARDISFDDFYMVIPKKGQRLTKDIVTSFLTSRLQVEASYPSHYDSMSATEYKEACQEAEWRTHGVREAAQEILDLIDKKQCAGMSHRVTFRRLTSLKDARNGRRYIVSVNGNPIGNIVTRNNQYHAQLEWGGCRIMSPSFRSAEEARQYAMSHIQATGENS